MANKDNLLPSIPDYYKLYVDPKVDLNTTPSQPCPFHNEKVGKSFSFSKQLGKWRCFGQCHRGGGVIELHQLNYRLKTKEEARKSLYQLCGIDYTEQISFKREIIEVEDSEVYRRRVYALAVSLAKDPESWLELDYIFSKVPFDVKELEVFCSVRGHVINST